VNALWVLPVVVLLVGMAAAFVAMRQTRDAAVELHAQLIRLGEVRVAVADVRAEAVRTRDAIEGLRHR
jgi:cytochrome c-type biogenesis protein CcmH/NrfF